MINRNFPAENIISEEEIEEIHQASLEILEKTGVQILNEEAREIFKRNGAEIEGEKVYLSPDIVEEYLDKAPSSFKLHARNPDNSVVIGGGDSVLAPGYGAPFVSDLDEGRRSSTFEDYVNFTKLASENEQIDVLGGVLVEPNDISEDIRHAKMLYAGAKYSDKCLMGSALGKKKARDGLKMASYLFGADEIIDDKSIVITLISTNSPLQLDKRMLGSLIEHAKYSQPVILASGAMTGSTGPMSIAGIMTLQNIELLTGIILAQMITPGNPVVYGPTASITDMQTAGLALGSSDYAKLVSMGTQMADYYGLPCRAGGALTDSLLPDAQAGYESMMILTTAINQGMDFIIHSAGILDSYMTMSYEKFIIDSEIIGMLADYQSGVEVSKETIAKEIISEHGSSGNYLTDSHTLEHMKDFRESDLSLRESYTSEDDLTSTAERANQIWKDILADFEAPYLDPVVEEKLTNYIENL